MLIFETNKYFGQKLGPYPPFLSKIVCRNEVEEECLNSRTGRILRPVPAFSVLSTCTKFLVSCAPGIDVSDHFADVSKMVRLGKGGQRDVDN